MALTPDNAPTDLIHKLSELDEKQLAYQAKVIDQVTALMAPAKIPELFFSTKSRHDYVYEQVPVGCDLGWMCYDPNVYDGAPDGNQLHGLGLTKDAAYRDYLEQSGQLPPLPTKTVDAGPFEPNETISAGTQDDWEGDDRE